jgi:hypothetical protein
MNSGSCLPVRSADCSSTCFGSQGCWGARVLVRVRVTECKVGCGTTDRVSKARHTLGSGTVAWQLGVLGRGAAAPGSQDFGCGATCSPFGSWSHVLHLWVATSMNPRMGLGLSHRLEMCF